MKSIFKKMIENSRNTACIISFGLGLTTLNCSVGDEVPVNVSGIYSENDYVLNQNEINNANIFCRYFYSNINPFDYTDQTIELYFLGFKNLKPYYKCNFNLKNFYIYYNIDNNLTSEVNNNSEFFINKWVVTTEINNIPSNNVLSYNINYNFYPLNTNWVNVGYDNDGESLQPINLILNTTTGGFTFPAVNTKEIQVEMQNNNGTILKSNKINLIVN